MLFEMEETRKISIDKSVTGVPFALGRKRWKKEQMRYSDFVSGREEGKHQSKSQIHF